jgi:hypothetical protein
MNIHQIPKSQRENEGTGAATQAKRDCRYVQEKKRKERNEKQIF